MRAMNPPRLGEVVDYGMTASLASRPVVAVTLSTGIGAQRVHIAGRPPIFTVIHRAFFPTSLDNVLRENDDHRRAVVRAIESSALRGVPGSPGRLLRILPTRLQARGARDRARPGLLPLPPVRGRSTPVTHRPRSYVPEPLGAQAAGSDDVAAPVT